MTLMTLGSVKILIKKEPNQPTNKHKNKEMRDHHTEVALMPQNLTQTLKENEDEVVN
jgi:hypothetical protein